MCRKRGKSVFLSYCKIMLPGDYIAMKLSGEICTTVSGLSEGMFWDFKNNREIQYRRRSQPVYRQRRKCPPILGSFILSSSAKKIIFVSISAVFGSSSTNGRNKRPRFCECTGRTANSLLWIFILLPAGRWSFPVFW